jgi:hypothetical protein
VKFKWVSESDGRTLWFFSPTYGLDAIGTLILPSPHDCSFTPPCFCQRQSLHLPDPPPAWPSTCLTLHLPDPPPACPSTCLSLHLPVPPPAYPSTCLTLHLPNPPPAWPSTCCTLPSLFFLSKFACKILSSRKPSSLPPSLFYLNTDRRFNAVSCVAVSCQHPFGAKINCPI